MATDFESIPVSPWVRVVSSARRAGRASLGFGRAKPLGMVGAVILIVIGIITITAPLIAPHDPTDSSFKRDLPESSKHLLGTDPIGRDIFSRLIMGSRISIYVGIVSVLPA